MDSKKYNELKNFVMESYNTPEILIGDYNNTNCKFNLARFLIKLEKHEDALEVLLTIKEDDTEGIEQWIWILTSIGICNDNQNAFEYFKKADELALATNEKFEFLVRGEIFSNYLYALKELNKEEELKAEMQKRINLFIYNQEYKFNSYLFNTYEFMARNESDVDKALEYLYEAMKYFPLHEYQDEDNFKRIWNERENNPIEAFNNILALTEHILLCWDI